jgi:hypothetical protein
MNCTRVSSDFASPPRAPTKNYWAVPADRRPVCLSYHFRCHHHSPTLLHHSPTRFQIAEHDAGPGSNRARHSMAGSGSARGPVCWTRTWKERQKLVIIPTTRRHRCHRHRHARYTVACGCDCCAQRAPAPHAEWSRRPRRRVRHKQTDIGISTFPWITWF